VVVIYALLSFIPFENILGFRFKSPEDAFFYQDAGEIIKVIEGEESAVIYAESGEGKAPKFYKKDKGGWMLRDFSILGNYDTLDLTEYLLTLDLYRAGDSNECIIIIDETLLHSIESVTDTQATQFKHFVTLNEALDEQFATYYAIIRVPDPNYELYVNGEKVMIESDLLTR
jgi:hypothetical protein